MLLAMVVNYHASAVVVFLQPFVIDLNDNRAWAAGGVTAEQLNDRHWLSPTCQTELV